MIFTATNLNQLILDIWHLEYSKASPLLIRLLIVSGLPILLFVPFFRKRPASERHMLWLFILLPPLIWEMLLALTDTLLHSRSLFFFEIWIAGFGILHCLLSLINRDVRKLRTRILGYKLFRYTIRGGILALSWWLFGYMVYLRTQDGNLCSWIWIAGFAVSLIRTLAPRLLRVLDFDRRQNWTQCTHTWGMDHIDLLKYGSLRIRQSLKSTMISPYTYGTLRPIIVVPESCDYLTKKQRCMAMQHELAHVERRDWLWSIVADIMVALYWFHPIFWIARRKLDLLCEIACHAKALETGYSSQEYKEMLDAVIRKIKNIQEKEINESFGLSIAAHLRMDTPDDYVGNLNHEQESLLVPNLVLVQCGYLCMVSWLFFTFGVQNAIPANAAILVLFLIIVSEKFLRWTVMKEDQTLCDRSKRVDTLPRLLPARQAMSTKHEHHTPSQVPKTHYSGKTSRRSPVSLLEVVVQMLCGLLLFILGVCMIILFPNHMKEGTNIPATVACGTMILIAIGLIFREVGKMK